MNGNAELLEYIFQNSQMGVETINQLLGITEDDTFKTHLKAQVNEYETMNEWAKEKLEQECSEAKGIDSFQKMSSKVMIRINTLKDKSPSHIAEMLIQGSTMGIIDATKNIKKYSNADKDIIELAEKLLKFEQNNVERLKNFLV